MLTCFAIALAAIIYAFPERLFAYTPLVGEPPAAPLHGAKTMLMVIAIAGTGIALNRSRKWQAAPIADKRRFALRTSLDVLTVTLVVVLVNMTYLSQLEKIHAKYGAALFRKYQGDGNYVAAIVLAFLIGIVSLGLLYVARRWNRRAEEFMVGEHVG